MLQIYIIKAYQGFIVHLGENLHRNPDESDTLAFSNLDDLFEFVNDDLPAIIKEDLMSVPQRNSE